MQAPRPQTGADHAALVKFLLGQSSSVTYASKVPGSNTAITVSLSRP